MKKKILSILIVVAFMCLLCVVAIVYKQNVKNDTSDKNTLSEEDQKLVNECKKTILDACLKLKDGNYIVTSFIGESEIFSYSVSADNRYCYLENNSMDIPDIYYDSTKDIVYYKYTMGNNIPSGCELNKWYYTDAKKAEALITYLDNRKNEVLINYMDYSVENSFVVNRTGSFNNDECLDLGFSYNGSKLFEDINGFSCDMDSDGYICHYYINSETNDLLGVKNNLGEVHCYKWEIFEIPDGIEDSIPFSMNGSSVGEL